MNAFPTKFSAVGMVARLLNYLSLPVAIACVYFASAAQKQAPPSSLGKAQRLLSVQALQIVDSEGRICARIDSNDYGGLLELLRPDENGKPQTFAWIGSSFESGPEFTLYETRGKRRAGFYLGLTGEPVYPRFEMTALNGKPIMSVNGGFNRESTFTLWEPGQDKVKFMK